MSLQRQSYTDAQVCGSRTSGLPIRILGPNPLGCLPESLKECRRGQKRRGRGKPRLHQRRLTSLARRRYRPQGGKYLKVLGRPPKERNPQIGGDLPEEGRPKKEGKRQRREPKVKYGNSRTGNGAPRHRQTVKERFEQKCLRT